MTDDPDIEEIGHTLIAAMDAAEQRLNDAGQRALSSIVSGQRNALCLCFAWVTEGGEVYEVDDDGGETPSTVN